MIYNFFAKTLQVRLQPMLRNIISPEQTTFLPLRFTLDNITLTQEVLHWAKTSKQPMVFLKLGFSKAFDKISWKFLFEAMHKMGISEISIGWVRLLFHNATAVVNLNKNPRKCFTIERKVCQG